MRSPGVKVAWSPIAVIQFAREAGVEQPEGERVCGWSERTPRSVAARADRAYQAKRIWHGCAIVPVCPAWAWRHLHTQRKMPGDMATSRCGRAELRRHQQVWLPLLRFLVK